MSTNRQRGTSFDRNTVVIQKFLTAREIDTSNLHVVQGSTVLYVFIMVTVTYTSVTNLTFRNDTRWKYGGGKPFQLKLLGMLI